MIAVFCICKLYLKLHRVSHYCFTLQREVGRWLSMHLFDTYSGFLPSAYGVLSASMYSYYILENIVLVLLILMWQDGIEVWNMEWYCRLLWVSVYTMCVNIISRLSSVTAEALGLRLRVFKIYAHNYNLNAVWCDTKEGWRQTSAQF